MRISARRSLAPVTPSSGPHAAATSLVVPAPQHAMASAPVLRSAFSDVEAETVRRGDFYRAPLAARRLPPLREAVFDPRIEPLSPATLPVPADVLDLLRGAKRVLVIGHVPPDGDCVGSALGLARALRALGKEADACVDDALNGRMRGIDADAEVKRAADLEGRAYDLVVVVDVSQGTRIGAALGAVQKAPNVLVLDHHNAAASREEVGVGDDAKLVRWVMPGLEASSLQVACVAERLSAEATVPLDKDAWSRIAAPLSAGVLTDTDHFKMPGCSLASLQMFKHLLQVRMEGNLDAAQGRVAYELPEVAKALLNVVPSSQKPASDAGPVVRSQSIPSARATVISCPKTTLAVALDEARGKDPRTIPSDLTGFLLDQLDRQMADQSFSVLLYETERGVQAAVRSRDGDGACALVESLFPGRGGGKPHAAAARPAESLEESGQRIGAWLKERAVRDEVRLRARAS